MIINWLRTWLPETPLRLVANVRQMNRIANILNDIQGVNCRIEKPTNAEGKGWMIIVDGGSDVKPEEGAESEWPKPLVPYGEGIEARDLKVINDALTGIQTHKVMASEGSGTETPVSQITVITAVQYDTTTHQFQVKTRTVKAIDPGTESAWTMITGGQGAECSPA